MIDERSFPGRQVRLLFAYLALRQGRPVPRDELADVLWEGSLPATWEKALGVLASKLRAVLDSRGTLTAAFGCYRLDLPEGSWVDVVAAEDAADEAAAALARRDLETAVREAILADSLARGPFLPGDDGTWVEGKRRELAGVRARALNTLAEALLRSGAAEESVRWAEQAVEAEPFRESSHRRLMEAHIAAGNRAEALRAYERCRRLLAEELGTFPSPETEALYRGLLEAPQARPRETPKHAAPAGSGGSHQPRRLRLGVGLGLIVAAGAVAAGITATRGGSAPAVLPNSLIRLDPQAFRVTQVIPVESQPDLVVAAGGFLWVTSHVLRDAESGALRNAGDRTLTRVDPSTEEAVVVGGGLAPCGLTADPSGDVWVANCYPRSTGLRDTVTRVDARTREFKQTFRVPGGDGFFRGLAYGGGSLWVGAIVGGDVPNTNTITEIDPQSHARRTLLQPLPADEMAWADGYGDLWITNFDHGSLKRLHASAGLAETVYDVVMNPVEPRVDHGTVWVADWATATVARLSAVGAPHVQRISLPTKKHTTGVWDLAVGPGAIWATTPREGTLWRIDPATNTPTPIGIPYQPTGVAADANNVWVTVRGR